MGGQRPWREAKNPERSEEGQVYSDVNRRREQHRAGKGARSTKVRGGEEMEEGPRTEVQGGTRRVQEVGWGRRAADGSRRKARGEWRGKAWRGHSAQGRRAQHHVRFDHSLEGSPALPVCKLVHEVARHAGCMAVEPEEAVVVAQGPRCPQCQRMGHTRVCLQLSREVRQLCGDVWAQDKHVRWQGTTCTQCPPTWGLGFPPPEFLVKM